MKFGSEVHADTFAPRLLSALGYAAEPSFFIRNGSIVRREQSETRTTLYFEKYGLFQNARFKLREPHAGSGGVDPKSWSWIDNLFVDSHELNGLKIVIMLLSNWDTKDARDRLEGSNNEIINTLVAKKLVLVVRRYRLGRFVWKVGRIL